MNCERVAVCEPRRVRTGSTGLASPTSYDRSPEPPSLAPSLLTVSPHDVLRLEILKLAQQQDSLSRLVAEHTDSLRVLLQKQQADICEIIDLRFKELPGRISIFGSPASPASPLSDADGQQQGQPSREASGQQNLPSSPSASSLRHKSKKTTTIIEEPEIQGVPAVEKAQTKSIHAERLDRLKNFVSSPVFEIIMGSVIVINITTIFFQLQWKGYQSAFMLGLDSTDRGYSEAEKVFDKLELFFNGIYLIELLLRLWVEKLRYFRSVMGCIDAVVVIVCCLQSFILEPAQLSLEETMVRLVRLFRLFRIIKIFRFMNTVEELRILLRTLSLSLGSLIWSMVLIGVIIIAAGVLMAQLLLGFIEDENADSEMREWVYTQYGSAARATFTMFEGAFTAAWTRKCEPLLENVSWAYGFFYALYVVTINFAMIRVISALFLKQTMQVAASDAERRAVDKMQERAKFLEDVRGFFEQMDESGDGVLDQQEFDHMLRTSKVMSLFEMLELTEAEARMLFEVLSGDEGVVDYREFLDGAMKMKHSSRAVESVQVLHEVTVLQRRLDNLSSGMSLIFDVVCSGKKWDHKAAPRRRRLNTRYRDSPRNNEEVAYLAF